MSELDLETTSEVTMSNSFSDRVAPSSRREKDLIKVMTIWVIIMFLADQLTKEIVVCSLERNQSVEVIPGFFNFVHVLNFGAAFGQFQNMGTWLLLLSLMVFAGIIIFLRKWTEGCAERYYALALILSGIAGNCCDRLFRDPAAVVDFLDFYIDTWHWPAFNVADSCICVGAAVYILSNLIRKEIKVSPPLQ